MKRKFVVLSAFLLALAMLFGSCGGAAPVDPPVDPPVETPPKYVIHPAALGENVEIHTAEQAAYLNDDPANIGAYTPDVANVERSLPKEIELSWAVSGEELPAGVTYEIFVATSPDLRGAKVYAAAGQSCKLCNLQIGTTYYWKVSFAEGDAVYESEIASFTTAAQGPRNLLIDGMTNCRDLGGWNTKSGRRVKQGLLFRTGRSEIITQEGKKTILEDLGVKTEIDLRGGNTSPLTSSGVRLLSYACGSNATVPDLRKALPDIFEVLADESNYPIFIHCQIGTDRTGTLAFLIGALLGVSEDDLYRDFCFSNFGKICNDDATGFTLRTPKIMEERAAIVLRRASGASVQAKVRSYLKSIGISDQTLDAVVEILLEGASQKTLPRK